MEKMNIDEVGSWLQDQGFCDEIQQAFKNQAMDGEAIYQALGTSTGPDCLKDVLPKFGERLKVYNALKFAIGKEMDNCERSPFSPLSDDIMVIPFANSKDSVIDDIYSPPSITSPIPMNSPPSVASTSSSMLSTPSTKKKASPVAFSKLTFKKDQFSKVPDPFPIPTFRERTEANFRLKKLTSDDRKYVVRTLATMLLVYIQRPSKKDCESVARSLLRKHSFIKEYDSWADFIYTRCQNCNRNPTSDKGDEEKSPHPKKRKIDQEKHFYPSLEVLEFEEDEVSHKRNLGLLQKELEKARSNVGEIVSLMARTFKRRREWILCTVHKVKDICNQYPFLQKAVYAAEEFNLIMQVDNLYGSLFEDNWKKYSHAVIGYAQASLSSSKDLKHALRSLHNDERIDDEDALSISALRCLGYFLSTKPKKKETFSSKVDIPFLLVEVTRGTPVTEAIDEENNHPHIIRFVDPDLELLPQIFIAIEQEIVLECKDMSGAVFALLACHYIFNIMYFPRVKDVLYFIQDKILGFGDSSKQSSIYTNTSTALDCYV